MVYLTGDTHNEFTRLSNKYFKKYDLEIGENDYIIVCGDLGLCWSKDKTFEWNCKWFAEKPYTLLWVQAIPDSTKILQLSYTVNTMILPFEP